MSPLVLSRNIAALLFFGAVLGSTQQNLIASCDMPLGWPFARLANEAYGDDVVESNCTNDDGLATQRCAHDAADLAENGCMDACSACAGDWGGHSDNMSAPGCLEPEDPTPGCYEARSEVFCECT